MLGPCSRCKNWKYTSARSDIHNNLVFEIFWIVLDCSLIRSCSHCVFEHFFMDVEAWVRRKVIVMLVTATEIIEHLSSIFLIYRYICYKDIDLPSNHSSGVPVKPSSVAFGTRFFFETNAGDLFDWFSNGLPSACFYFCCGAYFFYCFLGCSFLTCYLGSPRSPSMTASSYISWSGFGSLNFC